ncbi:MAG: hypothetical protein AB1666_12990 [Pseudomonadota bacterium]
MRFHHRLILCSAVPALLFMAALGVSVWGLLRTQEDFDRYIGTEQANAALTLAVVAIGVCAVFLVLMQRTIRRELGGDPVDARLGPRAIAAGTAVNQLDQMTQQNAALVEESAAAAESLKEQAHRLAEVVAAFRLHREPAEPPQQPRRAEAAGLARPQVLPA